MVNLARPSMERRLRLVRGVGLALVLLGVALAISGLLRSGGAMVAVGTSAYSFTNYQIHQMKRRVELYLPQAIAIVLLIAAITLPHAR